MRFCAGQAGAQLAFFSGFCATRRATNRQGQFPLGFHDYTMHRYSPARWSIVISPRVFFRPILVAEKFQPALVCSSGHPASGFNFINSLSSSRGDNVAAEHPNVEGSAGSREPASAGGRRGQSSSATTAIEAVPAQSDRGNRKLSSTTLRNCHVHHGPV